MKSKYLVGQKGQIVIEKSIRDALGIEPGFLAVQQLVGGHVEIHFYPPEHDRSLAGIYAQYSGNRGDLSWDQVRALASHQAAVEKEQGSRKPDSKAEKS